MNKERQLKRILAIILVVLILVLLFYALLPFMNAFFGAFILFAMFSPLFKWFQKRGLSKSLSSMIVVVLSLFVIIIPLFLILGLLAGEVVSFAKEAGNIGAIVAPLNSFAPDLELGTQASTLLSKTGSYLGGLIIGSVQSVAKGVINLILMMFILYFMFVSQDSLKKQLFSISPFNKKNTEKLGQEFTDVTFTTIVASGLLALLHGFLIGLAFLVFSFGKIFFWGFIAMILSFLPVVGISLIWAPTAIIALIHHDYFAGIGMLVWGVIASNVDNLIRPFLQSRIGKIHPLNTLLGVFIGIPVFGLLGIILGPLLLSYSVLIVRMFVEEYVA